MKGAGSAFRWLSRNKKNLLGAALAVSVALPLGIVLVYQQVSRNAAERTFDRVADLPPHRVGLLLGTAPRLVDGRANLYFEHRLEAALELFAAGKIERLLISGDHGTRGYNEPEEFRQRLLAAGVPDEKIHLDYAGFRTLDSVVRAQEVFGQRELLVISQRFHNERAIYLADHFGLQSAGFNARGVGGQAGLKNLLRESLARVKLMLDLVLGVQPRFLGERIELGDRPSLPG